MKYILLSKTGVVDGDAGNVIYWDYEYFRDVLDYYVRTKHTFVTGNLLVNLKTYENLSDKHKKLIEDAAIATMQAQLKQRKLTMISM